MLYYTSHICGITLGLNFKLDVGTLRLDQQVACQRYRQNFLDANSKFMDRVAVAKAKFNFSPSDFALQTA